MMVGKTISHYQILEKLGGGGMGVVYKARDLKLDRCVAIKFLPRHLCHDENEKQRFIREARAASSLEHTNICTIHEIDETKEGQLFICMAYYEGETLKKKIQRSPISLEDAVNFAIQVCAGLEKAHQHGIVHRDIKPANIMITNDGVVKIVDFGLAKLLGQSKITREGITLGTVPYMSPEQARGEGVDRRTDIWSLGVVMYEMLSGQTPFRGEQDQAIIYSIMNEEPKPLTGLRIGAPVELERMVNKCLNKTPDARYHHIRELATDLQKLPQELRFSKRTPAVRARRDELLKSRRFLFLLAPVLIALLLLLSLFLIFKNDNKAAKIITERKSIAVLPFNAITKSEEDEIFNEGIHDDIITQLTKMKDLKVIARTSVARYKNTEKRASEIGRELGVNALLEGSVRRSGDRIRIVAQLIDAQTEEHLWAETFDRNYSDIFSIQSDVAQQIAIALEATLTPEERHLIQQKPTQNIEAYDYFLKGNHYWSNYDTFEGNEKAAQMYERAVELDSTFALAYAKLAIVYATLYQWDYRSRTAARKQKARTALEKAVKLAPELPEVHYARGNIFAEIENDLAGALAEYEGALARQPNNSDIVNDIGVLCLRMRRFDDAAGYFKKQYELDPYQINSGGWVSAPYWLTRRWEDAEHWINIYLVNHPEHGYPYVRKVCIYVFGYGDLNAARAFINEGSEHVRTQRDILSSGKWIIELFSRNYREALAIPCSDTGVANLRKGLIYRLMGEDEKSKTHFDSARVIYQNLTRANPEIAGLHSSLGLAYAGTGRSSEALEEGEKAVELDRATRLLDDMLNPYTNPPLNLAHINILIGNYDAAIEQLEALLASPGELTLWRLKLDPLYDPLRSHPRFRKLLREDKEH